MSEFSEASIKKDYPDFQGLAVSNSNKFIREVFASEKPQEEKIYNIDIQTNGVIAAISFDYGYYSGDKLMQWGNEKWNDYNDISAGSSYMSKVKEYGNTVFNEHMECSAVLGITGLKKILFNGYNRATGATNVKTFDSKEEALDWLAAFK